MNGSLNLKIFLSVSLGLHLLFLSVLTFLYPNFKINHIPPLHIEVTLLPLIPETMAASIPIMKPKPEIKSHESHLRAELLDSVEQTRITIQEQRDWLQKEKNEEPLIKEEQKPESLSDQDEVKVNTPASDPQPVPPGNRKREMENRVEEKIEKEPIIQAMNISLQSTSTLTFERENSSIVIPQSKVSHGNLLPSTDSFDGQKNIGKLPSTSEDDIPPKAVKRVNPIYPRWAKNKGYQGEVILRMQLLSNGRVGEIGVKKSSGHEILDRSAIAAVKKWEFIPGRERNTPIWYWVNIPIKFQLQ